MINIRLMGNEQEIKQVISQIQKLKGLNIVSKPNRRPNRDSTGVRIYLDVEVKDAKPSSTEKKKRKLDEVLEDKAKRLQFLIYADGSKIRVILNAAHGFRWSVPIEKMDLNRFLDAVAINLQSVVSIQRLDIKMAEACDVGFPMVQRQSSCQEEYHLNLVHALINRYPEAGECEALLDLLDMYGRGPMA